MTQLDMFDAAPSTAAQAVTGSQAQLRAECRALFKRVAARILAVGAARGMAPIEVGRAADLDDSQARRESGRGPFERDLPLSALYRIAKALGVTVGDLLDTSRNEAPPESKETPVYQQHRIHTLQLPSGLWLVSTVSLGRRKLTNKDALTGAVTRIPGEYDSEEQAVHAAKEYIDGQMWREEGT